jgi:hypothetical protein
MAARFYTQWEARWLRLTGRKMPDYRHAPADGR